MRTKPLLILVAVVGLLCAYIFFVERHRPTTDEVAQRADKVFPGLEQDEVDGIDIRNVQGTIRLAKTGDEWRLVEPIDARADGSAVSSLLGALLNLSAQRTLAADEVDAAAYGLDDPPLAVTLHTGDTDIQLLVGEEAALGSNRAVSRDGAEVLLVPGWFADDLDKGLDDWRSRDLVEVFADDVASFELETADDRIRAVRDGDLWRLLEPLDDLADREHLRNVISNLNALRIETFLDDDSDLAKLGLDEPARRVTLVRSGGKDPVVLELGATREVDGATQVACRRGDGALFWIDDRAEISLGKAPVLWRSKTVYPFDSWDVEAVTFTAAGGESVAVRREDGLWQLDGEGEVDSSEVLERLSALSRLEAEAFDLVVPGTGELGSIELVLGGGEDEGTTVAYQLYRPMIEGGRAVVTVTGRSTVMSVAADAVDELLGDLGALRKTEAEPEEPGEPEEAVEPEEGTAEP